MKLDPVFTRKMQDWLNTPAADRDIMAGATMLLQLNRNRALYNSIMRKPEAMAEKLDYEMRKFLRMRIDDMAAADVVDMQAKVMPAAKETVESRAPVISVDAELPEAKVAKGKRADHDQLPQRIKALWDGNFALYKRVTMLYNECCAMQDANAKPCDIYEKLKMLADSDKKYRDNLAEYDAYVITESDLQSPQETDGNSASAEPISAELRLQRARKLLSHYRKIYFDAERGRVAAGSDPGERKATALTRMQECVTAIEECGGLFSPDTVAELAAIGINFKQ